MMTLYIIAGLTVFFGFIAIASFAQYKIRDSRLPIACQYDDLSSRKATIEEELTGRKGELEEARETISQRDLAQAELKSNQDWIEANKEQLLTLKGDRENQEAIRSEYILYQDKLGTVTEELKAKQTELLPLENRHKELSGLNNDLVTRSNGLKEDIRELEIKNDGLIKERNSLNKEKESLESGVSSAKSSLKESRDELAQIEKSVQEEKLNLQRIEVELQSLAKDKNRLEQDQKNLGNSVKSLRESCETLSLEQKLAEKSTANKKAELEEVNHSLEKTKNSLAELDKECRRQETEISVFQTRKDSLQKEISILEESLKVARETANKHGGKPDDQETLKDLWEPIKFPILTRRNKSISEEEALTYTDNYIKGKKLHFPARTLNAFHTAMKCNDISPMTVLAGISGTGKSEMPKRYAEGMGMHFTMLAVQPRWDSPQDLLGFYNYMEHRYKATELARSLVRFDQFNRSSWGNIPKACDDRSDRMLMVLLDEMNLARVEYYFSEFLSKLETRRGVNIKDPLDRVKAQIELEIGSGMKSMGLFPGRNVLFTGTMNEDESTQSLSDKVLDRASVLRFGKPNETNMAMAHKEIDQQDNGLLHTNWNNWCTDFRDAKPNRELTERIQSLNDAMNLLHKPFGHRVAQAIASYVENYPTWVGDGKKKAFADQIEQRILPKLRGIDLIENEKALGKIQKLIDGTQDDLLSIAFNEGKKDNPHGVFMWHGIDRSQEH